MNTMTGDFHHARRPDGRIALKLTIASTAAVTAVLLVAGPASAAKPDDHAPGLRSNMGLCSSFLAKLDPPVFGGETLGGNARSGVNHLIKRIGPMLPDAPHSPGDLYKVRAHQHPDAPAEQECTPRPPVGPRP